MSRFTHSVSEPHTGRFVSAIYQAMERTRRPAFFTPTVRGVLDGLAGDRSRSGRAIRVIAPGSTGISSIVGDLLCAAPGVFVARGRSLRHRSSVSDQEIEDLAAVHELDVIIDPCGKEGQIEVS